MPSNATLRYTLSFDIQFPSIYALPPDTFRSLQKIARLQTVHSARPTEIHKSVYNTAAGEPIRLLEPDPGTERQVEHDFVGEVQPNRCKFGPDSHLLG